VLIFLHRQIYWFQLSGCLGPENGFILSFLGFTLGVDFAKS